MDSNHRDFATYFPRVETVSGGGTYNIQLAQGSDILDGTPDEVDMTNDEVVAIRDTFLEAGTTYRFTLTPSRASSTRPVPHGQPADHGEHLGEVRSQAIDSAFAAAGSPVVMEFTPSRTDWYGLVIVREGVFGTYDLVRTII